VKEGRRLGLAPVFLDLIVLRINRMSRRPCRKLGLRQFRVFLLGRAAAITDNAASKAALSGGNDTSSERADFRDGAAQ